MNTIEEFKNWEINLPHTQAPRIGRVHIGLVQLSTDHSLEMDWAKLLGTQAGIFSSRVYYSSEMTPEALDKIASGISEASDLIAYGLPMDVMAFGVLLLPSLSVKKKSRNCSRKIEVIFQQPTLGLRLKRRSST